MKEHSNITFSKFKIQFGEDANSDINQILSSLVASFNTNSIVFKVGIIDKKLEPFTILNKLIRVKRINIYLHVMDDDYETVVGTFKFENCNISNIHNYEAFLKSFSIYHINKGMVNDMYNINANQHISVTLDADNIMYDEILISKKESKKLEELKAYKSVKLKTFDRSDSYDMETSNDYDKEEEYRGEIMMGDTPTHRYRVEAEKPINEYAEYAVVGANIGVSGR